MITLKSTLKVTVVFLCIISIAFFTTCKGGIGLGGTIDINPPTIYAAYPPANAVVRDTFTLKGMIDDDVGVKTVTVSYIKADGHPASARAAVDNGSKTWQVVLNQKDSNGKFLIGDGRQVFNILAEDQSGKTASIEWFLTIDNTPPLLILNRPSTKALNPGTSYRDGDAFGADFWLVGQVYDKSDVAKLEIEAKAVGSSAPHIETVYNIPQNIRLKVTSFSTGGGTFYNTLYGSNTREDGKKNFSYTVRVYDSAKTYTNPGEAANSSEGNYTDVYYLSDDLYEKVFSKPDNKIQDVYEVLYGTAPASITNPAEIKTEFANKKIGGGAGQPVGTFALNPSLNPRFEIVGRTPSKNASGTLTPSFSNFFASSLLQVRLSRNLDDVPLNEVKPAGAPADPSDPDDDTYRFSHFFLAEWDTYKTYLADLNFDINTDSIYSNVSSKTLKSGLIRIPNNGITCEKEGGNYLFTIPIHKTTDLTYGKQYVLLARGRDKGIDGRNKNELIAAQGEGGADLYGITLVSTSQPPTVSVVKINNTGSGGGNITEQVYIKKGDNVSFSLDLSEIATVAYRLKQGLTEVLSTRSQSVVPPLHPTMPITINNGDTGFNQTEGGNYQLVIKATNDGGGTSPEQTYYLVYDVKGPQIKVIYPVDNAKLDRDSKLLEISGTAFDAGVGLKTPAPLTVTLTKEGGSPQTVNLADNGENWKSQPIDLSGSNYGDGKYTLTVTAQDTFDQPTTVTRTFVYDAAPPAITGLTVDGIAVTNGSKVYTKNGTVTVSGTLVETYEVKEFTIKGQTMPLSAGPFTKSLTLAEESHSIVIKVKDKADKETTQTVTVVTDQTLPEFENIDFAGQAASGAPGAAPIVTTDNPIRITGTIKDSVTGRTVSGVKEVNYAIADSIDASTVWKPLSGEFTGSDYTVNGFVQIPAPGVKKVNIKVTDNAGNEKIFTHAVQVIPATVAQFIFEILDGNTPADTVKKNAGVLYAKGQFKVKIGGILATAPAAGLPIEVEIKKEGTPPTVDPGDFFDNWNPAAKPKILTTNTPSEYTVKPSVDAGEYTITITAQGQERSQTVVVDKTGPAITIVEPSTVASTTQRPVFKASISDNAGIKAGSAKVYYKKVTVPPSIAEHSFTLVKDSDGSYSFTPASDMEEGTYELYFSAEDTLGNKTTTETTPRQKIIIDTALPALTEVKVNSKAGSLVYIKSSDGDVSITGKATDSYGIEKVEILENGAVKREIPSTAILPPDYTWTASFSGSDAFADGSHNLTIRVTDKAGKTAELQKTVVVDRVAPTINPLTHGLWRNTRTLFVTGTASDTISNVYIVEAIVTGGTPLQETLTLLSGMETWSGNLTLNEGDNTVKFRVTDKAGNTAETPAQTIKVDTGKPVITLITPANGQVRIKDQTYQVALTVSDIGSSGIKKIEYATAADFVSATDYMTSGGSVTIGLTGITSDVTYYFRAVDEAGNTSDSVRVSIQKDSAPPEVAFISHHDNQEVNKKITIRGSASDDKELTSVKIINADGGIDLTGISDSSGVDPADSETAGNKALFKGTKAYNWRFTLDTEQYTDNTELKLKAIATDAAGNIMEKELTLKVNQNSDRPQIVITNLTDLIGTVYLTTGRTLYGSILDDDGAVKKLEVSETESGPYAEISVSSGSWNYTFTNDGEKKLYFKITDKEDSVFTSAVSTIPADMLQQPKTYAKELPAVPPSGTDLGKPVIVKIDNTPPQFGSPDVQFTEDPSFGSGLHTLSGADKFGNKKIYLQIKASDAAGIKTVTVSGLKTTPILLNRNSGSAGGIEVWRSGEIDLGDSSITGGTKRIAIELEDNAGAKTIIERAAIVDKTAPTIKLNYPLAADVIGGKVTFSGTITDIGDAGVNKDGTKYMFTKKVGGHEVTPPANSADWKPMTASTPGSWNFEYDFKDISDNPNDYGSPNADNNNYYDIPVYIRTEDMVGNTEVHKKVFVLNPDGTKPVVKVLSPAKDSIVGGTIQIFGIANVAVGTPADIGEAYIQFSKDGNFNDTGDGTFGSTDWYNNGDGQLIEGTDVNGAVQWTKTINVDGSFNPVSGDKWRVYFRVRAKNKTVLRMGEWTEKITIEIDKTSPTIGSPNQLQIKNENDTGTAENYTPNMWIGTGKKLIGSLYDESGLKSITISGDLKNGTTYTLSTAKANGWITEDTVNTPSSGTARNYNLKIPLNLNDLSNGAKQNKEFKVKIDITEDTTHNLSSSRELTFRFDTDLPFGDFGESKHIGNGMFTSSSITDATLAGKIRSLAPSGQYTDIGILADNYKLTITGVTGNTVSFTPSPPHFTAGTHNYILYQQERLIYNNSGNWILKGVGNDSGSGIKEVKAKVTVASTSTGWVTMTETNSSNKISKQLGGQVTWQAPVDLASLTDGKGTLEYVITDNSGNVYTAPPIEVRVKNNPVEVTKITLKTEIGGAAFDTVPQTAATPKSAPVTLITGGLDTVRDYAGTVSSKNFAFKSLTDSKIQVEFTGGGGQVTYTLKYNGNGLTGHTMQNISSGDLISLTQSDLQTIGNTTGETPKELVLELWDNAAGCTQSGTDPLTRRAFAEVKIRTLFDALDTKPPTVVVLPFHWNSENDNSLYEHKRSNGHVEIAPVAGIGNTYSSVSGKVTLRGFVYDNVKVNTVKAELPFSPALTVTATRNGTTWTSDKTMAADGAELKVTRLGADYLGFYLKWELSFDSSKMDMDVGTIGHTIKIIANDGTNGSTETNGTALPTAVTVAQRDDKKSATDTSFSSVNAGQFIVFSTDEQQYFTRITSREGNTIVLADDVPTGLKQASVYAYTASKTNVQVNSVPYVTEVKTAITKTAKRDFDRSALGFYPVYAGEKITLKGFNITSSPSVKLGSKDLTSKVSAYSSTAGTFAVEIEDAADVKTGELTVTVGSVKAINNGNKNPVIAADGTVTEAVYNAWQNRANKRLADDLKLSVWKVDEFDSSVQKDITSPMLKIAPDSKWYMSYGEGIPDMVVNKNGSKKKVDQSYNKFHNTAVAYDAAGNIYAVATNTDRIGDNSSKFSFYSRTSGTGIYFDSASNQHTGFRATSYQFSWTGKARLEKVFNQNIYNINRVPRPKLAVTGNAASTKVYISYFDANHSKNPVKLRYGTVNSANDFTGGVIDGGTDVSTAAMDSLPNGSAPGYHTIADDDTLPYKGGSYVAHGVTSTGVAAVAWYDASEKRLVYSYNTAPQTPVHGGAWQTNARVIDEDFAGWYVDLTVDKNDGIHIAYYSSSSGDLKYAYLQSYNANHTVVTVDSYLSVGTQITINTREESGHIVPYISYFQSAFTQTPSSVRVAWLPSGVGTAGADVKDGAIDDLFTGAWEVMTIPMKGIIPKDETICNGVPTSGRWGSSVVLGFMSDSGYKKAVLRK